MPVTTISIDGLNEEAFRRSIESRLRQGKAGTAVDQLRALLVPYVGPGRCLPDRFLTVKADDLFLIGWDGLDGAIRRHDQPGRRVSALSIAFGWPGENGPQPNAEGRLAPHIETSYFTDEIFPFSQSARDDLLDGYSIHGCTWGDDCEATDAALSLTGIDDLNGALAMLEARLLASEEPDEEGIRAGSLGASLLSALLFQAVGQRIERDGLPRPLCVMAGSNGVYPYFDAPVVGISDVARKAAEAEAERTEVNSALPAPRYSSLVMTGIPRAKKRAVLVLEEQEEEMAVRLARLRGMGHARGETDAAQPEALADWPAPYLPDAAPETAPESIIAAAPGGPLLAKKPVKPAWDFRDMLGGRELEPPTIEPPLHDPPLLEPDDFPARPVSPSGGELPVGPALPGPGFVLIEPALQERLHALITMPAPRPADKIQSGPSIQPEPFEPAGQSDPLWLADDDTPPPLRLRLVEAIVAAPRRWWARLRGWVRV